MKILVSLLTIFAMLSTTQNTVSSLFDYKVKTIEGKDITLEAYKGNVILIVNVASKCGYTPQYEGLQDLYEKYGKEGLTILGFPANNFNNQEPGSNEEIKQFCTLEYGVDFPMFSKVSVKGENQAPIFNYLTSQPNPDFEGEIKWNFEKFLIDREGNLKRRFRSSVKPESEEIIEAIKTEL